MHAPLCSLHEQAPTSFVKTEACNTNKRSDNAENCFLNILSSILEAVRSGESLTQQSIQGMVDPHKISLALLNGMTAIKQGSAILNTCLKAYREVYNMHV